MSNQLETYLNNEFEQNIPNVIRKALSYCTKTADEERFSIFLIGGIVRDIIINKQNFDVDITVKGNAIEFAQLLQSKYPDICQLKETHDPFKTAKVWFHIDDEYVKVDLASTRKESYPYPASLPVVEEIGCDLYEDVIRRDFTINSMALSLNSGTFCQLIDYLEGYEDLKQGVIRVLHPNSFIDDPTRIIRALKFSVRFGYPLCDETRDLMQQCLGSGRFDNLGGERVKMELKQALNINKDAVLARFIEEGIYRLVNAGIRPEIRFYEQIISEYRGYLRSDEHIWLIYLHEIANSLCLSCQEQAKIKLPTAINTDSKWEIYESFEKFEIESILVYLAKHPELKSQIDLYIRELQDINLNVNGESLIELGVQQGPVIGKLLREVLKAKVSGDIHTPHEEYEYLKTLLKTY